jgi:methyl-accepting chemotaxis protein
VSVQLLTFLLVLGLLALALAFVVHHAISKPVHQFAHRLAEIAEGGGDLSSTIRIDRNDEIGTMAQEFNRFLGGLRNLVDQVKTDMRKVALIAGELRDNSGFLASSVIELTSTTQSVAQHADTQKVQTQSAVDRLAEISAQSRSVAGLADQMDQNLGQSSSAIEQMAANIRSVARRSQDNDQAGESLRVAMENGSRSVETLGQTIVESAASSETIQEMIKVIVQIAAQTNLLAMNAAIEAAHAGDAGRGFAVVAEEIRKLADESATSAKEIQGVVDQIARGFSQLQEASTATGKVFTTLMHEVEVVRNGSREIAHSMEEQQLANDTVLKTTLELGQQSVSVKQSIQAQLERTEAISTEIQSVAGLSLQVAEATKEESQALQETSGASTNVQRLATELDEIVTKVELAFQNFRTQGEE